MLVVVEGPLAVGKSTLLRSMPPERVVAEEWEALGIRRGTRPQEPRRRDAQWFWVGLQSRRWELLLETEAEHGVAYTDMDLLNLYYSYSLVTVGEVGRDVFEEGYRLMLEAMAEWRLGFVEQVVYLRASVGRLAERKAGDPTRSRRAFDLHVRLGPAMETYYAALERLRPGSVRWVDVESDMRHE